MRLRRELQSYSTFSNLSKQIVPEFRVLYPQVERVSLSQMVSLTVDSMHTDTITVALLSLKEEMDAEKMKQMQEWLKTRTGAKKMKLVVELETLEELVQTLMQKLQQVQVDY